MHRLSLRSSRQLFVVAAALAANLAHKHSSIGLHAGYQVYHASASCPRYLLDTSQSNQVCTFVGKSLTATHKLTAVVRPPRGNQVSDSLGTLQPKATTDT